MIATQWFFGAQDLADVHFIRRRVFIEEQGIDEKMELDGTDPECIHLVAYDDEDKPVATGRIRITKDDFCIGRVAVLPEERGKDYGKLIMQVLIHSCYSMGGERQVVHAQLSVQSFYEMLGFTAFGDMYEEAGIPHISMEHIGDSEQLCKKSVIVDK